MNGDQSLWGLQEHLLATVIDVLQWANYQRSDTKRSRPPEPVPRPGVANKSGLTRTTLTPAQIRARLETLQQKQRG